ncbi:DUF1523 family protein [Anianabacter salinae]|uniref:DUF1523 family protein n=1 Tax=Anianabacter salinae TaxID=2851023 RepID=UPI00225DE4D8|nr:DUF1523 family protein [Anianabacter salinae]MBV0913050.1 DUF1523 family protein [Anianabacter salinae]
MRYVKWTIYIVLALLLFAFLHYTLPQRDVARITDTYEKRIDFGENSIFWASPDAGNDPATANRDVFFIQTVQPGGRVMVYRNEDTGWGWPPYLKFDTANLQAEASDLRSDRDTPRWAVITHYGWRSEFLSIYPNAVSVREVDDPKITLIPWMNIVILVTFVLFILTLRQIWLRFWRRNVDPVLDDAGERWDRVDDRWDEGRGRFRKWLDSWRGK